jgi:hypothetical protein
MRCKAGPRATWPHPLATKVGRIFWSDLLLGRSDLFSRATWPHPLAAKVGRISGSLLITSCLDHLMSADWLAATAFA